MKKLEKTIYFLKENKMQNVLNTIHSNLLDYIKKHYGVKIKNLIKEEINNKFIPEVKKAKKEKTTFDTSFLTHIILPIIELENIKQDEKLKEIINDFITANLSYCLNNKEYDIEIDLEKYNLDYEKYYIEKPEVDIEKDLE